MTTTTVLRITRGLPYSVRFVYGGSAAPVDNTGWTAHMQIRNRPGGSVWYDGTDANGSIVLGGRDGSFTLEMSAVDTEAIPPNTLGEFDLFGIPPGGSDPVPIVAGQVVPSDVVTQPV